MNQELIINSIIYPDQRRKQWQTCDCELCAKMANAVVERFFGSLKHEWLTNVIHLTREGIINDVNNYIRYYNGTRLHSTLGYKTPNEYENSLSNVCN